MNKLKPCPFCGSRAMLDFANKEFVYTSKDGIARESGFYYTVKCNDKYCGCQIGIYELPEMAVEAWNRRASDG